jgi:Dehydrogenases with different specificities (related to short-chain alcohol dehydrogenases)
MNNVKGLFDLTGKIALVSGASSGLGADAAFAYAEAGADVAIIARRLDKLEGIKQKIQTETGRKVEAVECDVTNEESIKKAVQTVLDQFGRIDILLNNAGVAVRGSVETMTTEDWDRAFNTNVRSQFLLAKYIAPGMKEHKYGKIVNIASVNAVIGDKSELFVRHSYNSSKAAVQGLTVGMAASYAQYGITVNAVGPGLFESEMTANTLFKSKEFLAVYNAQNPSSRPGSRGELNGTILYLSSDASSYVQGQLILVDGGASIV